MTSTPQAARTRVAELYRTLGHSVLRRAQRILGSREEAEDIVHDLFLRMTERPDEFLRAREPAAFLYGAVTHACMNRLRDGKNRLRLLEARSVFGAQAQAPADALSVVRQVLMAMPPELAEVTVYYHMDEMTHAEIAEVIKCSRRHVGDLLERARRYYPVDPETAAIPIMEAGS